MSQQLRAVDRVTCSHHHELCTQQHNAPFEIVFCDEIDLVLFRDFGFAPEPYLASVALDPALVLVLDAFLPGLDFCLLGFERVLPTA